VGNPAARFLPRRRARAGWQRVSLLVHEPQRLEVERVAWTQIICDRTGKERGNRWSGIETPVTVGLYWGRNGRDFPTASTSCAASVQWAIASAGAQAWEFMAFCFSLPAGDVSLHLTTFSLQYTPPVVACVCIHLACKWSNWEIPVSTDGKHWWEYVDGTVTLELLDGKFWSEVPPQKGSDVILASLFLGLPFKRGQFVDARTSGLAKVSSAAAASVVQQRWQKACSEMSLNVVSDTSSQYCPISSVAPLISKQGVALTD